MVHGRASDAAPAQTAAATAPVVKRKRRASCLGEQERRERKRAIDREAQRSLREKTKTHIAELERTIEILRTQDGNGATASLLSEIEGLRTENERLKDIIDSVKSVVGHDLQSSRSMAPAAGAENGQGENHSLVAASVVGQTLLKPRSASFNQETRPSPPMHTGQPTTSFDQPTVARRLDLDGMTLMTDGDAPVTADANMSMSMDLGFEALAESPEEEGVEELPWDDELATATWTPMLEEIFGSNWRCPSPTILHIGSPDDPSTSSPGKMCPIWIKSNEIFSKVFNCPSPCSSSSSSPAPGPCSISPSSLVQSEITTTTAAAAAEAEAEAGLLYQGIASGWASLPSEWTQSPILNILQQVDDLLFRHLPNIERLAVAYKSLKLLQYYRNATTHHLDRVPDWLRPSFTQASTRHPIAVDFFAWPTLRERLLRNYTTICATGALSSCYSRYVRFDWPFAFEDAFFCDPGSGSGSGSDSGTGAGRAAKYYPSPLFERYHGDLRYWRVDEVFYETFPEMRGDIEGDRRRERACANVGSG